MRVDFTSAAANEYSEALEYYGSRHGEVGERFDTEVQRASRLIAEYPHGWPVERGEIRRFVLHTFPFKLLYAIEEDRVLVLAVMHMRQRPREL